MVTPALETVQALANPLQTEKRQKLRTYSIAKFHQTVTPILEKMPPEESQKYEQAWGKLWGTVGLLLQEGGVVTFGGEYVGLANTLPLDLQNYARTVGVLKIRPVYDDAAGMSHYIFPPGMTEKLDISHGWTKGEMDTYMFIHPMRDGKRVEGTDFNWLFTAMAKTIYDSVGIPQTVIPAKYALASFITDYVASSFETLEDIYSLFPTADAAVEEIVKKLSPPRERLTQKISTGEEFTRSSQGVIRREAVTSVPQDTEDIQNDFIQEAVPGTVPDNVAPEETEKLPQITEANGDPTLSQPPLVQPEPAHPDQSATVATAIAEAVSDISIKPKSASRTRRSSQKLAAEKTVSPRRTEKKRISHKDTQGIFDKSLDLHRRFLLRKGKEIHKYRGSDEVYRYIFGIGDVAVEVPENTENMRRTDGLVDIALYDLFDVPNEELEQSENESETTASKGKKKKYKKIICTISADRKVYYSLFGYTIPGKAGKNAKEYTRLEDESFSASLDKPADWNNEKLDKVRGVFAQVEAALSSEAIS